MDSFFTAFTNTRFDRSFDSLKNFNRLSVPVQKHLRKVYETLAATVLISAIGAYLHILWGIGGILTGLGSLFASVWIITTPFSPSEEGKRLRVLAAAAFLNGATVGPLVEQVIDIDASILVTALVGTASIFACFSGAAVFARRRELLFLGGILSSATSLLLWMGFASYFFGGHASYFAVEIYGGLLIFIGYILFDTQMIIEKADRGDYDYIKHSLDLFVDLIGLFVRLLIIVAKNSSKSKSEREREERRRKGNTTFR